MRLKPCLGAGGPWQGKDSNLSLPRPSLLAQPFSSSGFPPVLMQNCATTPMPLWKCGSLCPACFPCQELSKASACSLGGEHRELGLQLVPLQGSRVALARRAGAEGVKWSCKGVSALVQMAAQLSWERSPCPFQLRDPLLLSLMPEPGSKPHTHAGVHPHRHVTVSTRAGMLRHVSTPTCLCV